MNIEIGKTAWTSARCGVILVSIVEIESKSQEQVRVRDKSGKFHVVDANELHDTERGALKARLDQERFWAEKYRAMAWTCDENVSRISQRLLRIETCGRKGKVA